MVLSYDEQSGKNEYRPITQVHVNPDPKITFL